MQPRRRLRAAAAAIALASVTAGAAAGCGVQLEAAKLTISVNGNRVQLLPPSHPFHGGEAVITIENYSSERHQFVLAATPLAPSQFPAKLATALTAQADSAVLDVTSVMKPETVAPGGAFGLSEMATPTQTTLHDYLHRGYRYVLFDRLGGRYNRVYLTFVVS
jgi:hypothetical protein